MVADTNDESPERGTKGGHCEGEGCERGDHGPLAKLTSPSVYFLPPDPILSKFVTPAFTRTLFACSITVATVQASGDVDNEGLIGREREGRRFGLPRAAIFRRLQADLGLLAAFGAQQWHHPTHFSITLPSPRQS